MASVSAKAGFLRQQVRISVTNAMIHVPSALVLTWKVAQHAMIIKTGSWKIQ